MIQFVDKDYLLIVILSFFNMNFINEYIINIYYHISIWHYLCKCFLVVLRCYNAEYKERIIVKSFLEIQRIIS